MSNGQMSEMILGKDDLIRRQDAIKALEKWKEGEARTIKDYGEVFVSGRTSAFADAIAAMVFVPSAEPEIIRCKDCRWWDKSEDSPFGYCMAMKHGYMSSNWEIGIYRKYKDDFYCADAERRTDE